MMPNMPNLPRRHCGAFVTLPGALARGLAAVLRVACLALVPMLAPAPGFAHAVLLQSAPADGALLQDPPAAAELRFNEPVQPLAIRLIGPDGIGRDLTAATAGGARLAVPLGDLARGTHVLSWRVASGDGHPVAGALVFSLGQVTGAAAPPPADPWVARLLWALKLAMSAGLVPGIGGALFGALAGLPPDARPWLRRLILSGLAAGVAALGLHGADALGLPLAALASAAPWEAGWRSGVGTMTLLAPAAGLAGLAGLRLLAVAGVALLAAGYAATGHASAAAPHWLTRPAVFLHLAMLCFWLGALLPLALWLRRPDGAAALARFSRLIPAALLLLAGSGVALALVQMGSGLAGWSTAYGRILAAKLALLVLLLLLAAANRWALTGPALQGAPAAGRRLRRSIGAELALAFAILALAAGWRFAPPPRALAVSAAAAAAPVHIHLHGPEATADVAVTPGRAGPAAVEIRVADGAMQPIVPQAVTLGLALPGQGVERLTYPAVVDADGVWHVSGLVLPLPGSWQLELELRLSRFAQARLGGTLAIAPAR